MATTKWNRELITHLETERALLCEPQMMRVAGMAGTNNAGL